jgi:MtN3 and saliva related transmembrane protein
LTMFLLFFVGILLWFSYGCYLKSLSMIIANIVTGFLSLVIIYYKLKYK